MKSTSRCIKLGFFVLVLLLPEIIAHPAWVQEGVVANYQGIGSFKKDGQYQGGAQMNIVERVDSVSNGRIVVTSTFTEPTSGYTFTNSSSYGPNDIFGAFWVDDRAAQNAKDGDKVGIFTVKRGPYQDLNGKIWSNAVMLESKDKVEIRAIYDERTGLLIHYAEVYPNQETYIDFKSINVDLSTYQTPAGVGDGGTNETGAGGGFNLPCCGGIFLIFAGFCLALVKG